METGWWLDDSGGGPLPYTKLSLVSFIIVWAQISSSFCWLGPTRGGGVTSRWGVFHWAERGASEQAGGGPRPTPLKVLPMRFMRVARFAASPWPPAPAWKGPSSSPGPAWSGVSGASSSSSSSGSGAGGMVPRWKAQVSRC